MARRRGQQIGYAHMQGNSWYLAYREDVLDEHGYIQRVRRNKKIADARKYSKREAQRIARSILAKVDVLGQQLSPVTVTEFVERFFKKEVVWSLKNAGKKHYAYILDKHVLPAIGEQRLTEVRSEHIQLLVKAKVEAGYSIQTVKHIRNAVSAVFSFAKVKRQYHADNPAIGVKLPEMVRRQVNALTFEQARQLLNALTGTAKTMVLLSLTTSMNIAELLALRWKYVNLSDTSVTVGGEVLPRRCAAVRGNYYRGMFGSVKARARRRNLPLAHCVVEAFEEIRSNSKFTGPEDLVFTSTGVKPIDEKNLLHRALKPAGTQLGIPWVSWHAFRHSHATFAEDVEMPFSDRQAQMGHSAGNMTLHYTHSDLERRRGAVEAIAGRLVAKGDLAEGSGVLTLIDTNDRAA